MELSERADAHLETESLDDLLIVFHLNQQRCERRRYSLDWEDVSQLGEEIGKCVLAPRPSLEHKPKVKFEGIVPLGSDVQFGEKLRP